MPVLIRKATSDDFEVVARLNRQVQAQHAEAYPGLFRPASPDTLMRSAFDELLTAPEMTTLVADEGGVVVGYLTAEAVERPDTPYRFGQHVLCLHQICVDRSARRKGRGRALLAAALDLADGLGITRVELDTWASNTDARSFFESVGFRAHNVGFWLDRGGHDPARGRLS